MSMAGWVHLRSSLIAGRAEVPNADALSALGIQVLPHERLVIVNGQRLDLTAREFDILSHLAEHPGWVYSAEQLADGDEHSHDFSLESVRVHIAHLRHKFELAGLEGVIGTVRGVGYRLTGPEATSASADPAPPDVPEGELACAARLRDCLWLLEQAVVELAAGTSDPEVTESACEALETAQMAIAALLDKRAPGTL